MATTKIDRTGHAHTELTTTEARQARQVETHLGAFDLDDARRDRRDRARIRLDYHSLGRLTP